MVLMNELRKIIYEIPVQFKQVVEYIQKKMIEDLNSNQLFNFQKLQIVFIEKNEHNYNSIEIDNLNQFYGLYVEPLTELFDIEYDFSALEKNDFENVSPSEIIEFLKEINE